MLKQFSNTLSIVANPETQKLFSLEDKQHFITTHKNCITDGKVFKLVMIYNNSTVILAIFHRLLYRVATIYSSLVLISYILTAGERKSLK